MAKRPPHLHALTGPPFPTGTGRYIHPAKLVTMMHSRRLPVRIQAANYLEHVSRIYTQRAAELTARSATLLASPQSQTLASRAMVDSALHQHLARHANQSVLRPAATAARKLARRAPAVAIAAAGIGIAMSILGRGGSANAASVMRARATQERRTRARPTTLVRGHYATGPNGTVTWVRQHTRSVG